MKTTMLTPTIKQCDSDYEVNVGEVLICTCGTKTKAQGVLSLLVGGFYALSHLEKCNDKESDVAESGSIAIETLEHGFGRLGLAEELGTTTKQQQHEHTRKDPERL